MDQKLYEQLGAELLEAEDHAHEVKRLTDRYPDITKEDAYKIQNEIIKLRLARGEHIIGKKIGLSCKAMQEMAQVDEPDFGVMTNAGLVEDGSTLHMHEFIHPRYETEIVFIMKKTLDKEVITLADVIDATQGVMPGLEIVDSRIEDWKIRIQDTIADSAAYGRIVLGGNKIVPLNDIDLTAVPMSAWKNGKLEATGCSAAVMDGNPINAILWLARKMKSMGTPLQAGEMVLSGAFVKMVPFEAGDHLEVNFGQLGSIHINIDD